VRSLLLELDEERLRKLNGLLEEEEEEEGECGLLVWLLDDW